jgi:hypothetical protein
VPEEISSKPRISAEEPESPDLLDGRQGRGKGGKLVVVKSAIAWPICFMGIFAILCITILELYSLHLGHDGLILATTVALIAAIVAGIGGFRLRGLIDK